jgi:hypothetical protein
MTLPFKLQEYNETKSDEKFLIIFRRHGNVLSCLSEDSAFPGKVALIVAT